MNVNKFTNNNKIIFLSGTFDQKKKAKFINTCDAMIHARSVGESFGSSCAEFAIKNKPILTYGFCRQRAHYKICTSKSYERSRIAGKKKVNAFRDGLKILISMIKLVFRN